ncbi:MAG TPA: hypothetical protein VF613_17380 [Longimicrobium sp.]|jgi:hypothetical protein
MQIVETTAFSRRVADLLSDDEYRALQVKLRHTPEMGRVIVGAGGARKVRWALRGGGKSGGVRVIYYHAVSREIILMLLIYAKSDQDGLTGAQKAMLRRAIERWLHEPRHS